jgi:putative transposase
MRLHRGRKGERRSFAERDYAHLLSAAHQQLGGPIVLVWDNLNTHLSTVMQTFVDTHADWLTVVRLPGYAPELNPTDGVWANLKNGLGNLAAHSIDDLARMVRTRLKRMQYRPDLINGFLAETGLVLQPT